MGDLNLCGSLSKNYVFIIGIARTGSKIYRNCIVNHSDIDILNETHYLSPRWLRQDFCRTVSNTLGYPLQIGQIDQLVNLMYQKKFQGTFWQMDFARAGGSENCIQELDREELARRLRKTDISFKSIFEVVMVMHGELRNKSRSGAKFPVNIACIRKFYNWFPKSQYIHITRDPRAIYASMKLMDLRKTKLEGKTRELLHATKRLAYLVDQYRCAVRVHQMMAANPNYILFHFEDIVSNPEIKLKELCDFLSIPFISEMLSPRVQDSSFKETKLAYGFDTEAMNRWRKVVSHKLERIIRLLLGRSMQTLGYENIR